MLIVNDRSQSCRMDRFEVDKKIGAGASSTAYLAHLVHDPAQLFVLKRLPIEKVSMSEMGVLYKLNHPAIVRCHEAFTHDGDLFLVMQYADGGDLERVINSAERRRAPPRDVLPLPTVDRLFIQLCLGLQFCHAQRTVHRDIKTSNILVSKDLGRAMLGDFGLAKELSGDAKVANTMVAAGSQLAVAPETVNGQGFGFASDVWALGCVLYEMITFKKPFPYSNLNTLLQKLSTAEYDPLPASVPGYLRRIIKGMLQADPNKRYSLQECLGEFPRKQVLAVQEEFRDLLDAPRADLSPKNDQPKAGRRGRRGTSPGEAGPGKPPLAQSPSKAKASAEELSTGPLDEWVKWKQREFDEIEAYLRLFDGDSGAPVVVSPGTVERFAVDDDPSSPMTGPPPRSPSEGQQMNANRARRMLPSPQALNAARPSAVAGGPPDVAVRPLHREFHDDPAKPSKRQEQVAKREAGRAELNRVKAAGRQHVKESRGDHQDNVELPRDFPAGGGHNMVRHLTPPRGAVRPTDDASTKAAPPPPAKPTVQGDGSGRRNAPSAPMPKPAAKERPNVRDMIREHREKAQASGSSTKPGGANFEVEIVLPGNLQNHHAQQS